MKKKVVFIINRTNEFKYFSSTINFFLKKKISVEILFLSNEDKNEFKYYLDPKRLKSSLIKKTKKRFFQNKDQLQNYFVSEIDNIYLIFNLTFLSKLRFKINDKLLKAVKNKWCVINHGTDNFTQFKDEKTDYDYRPIFFVDTKYYLNFGKKWVKKFSNTKNILFSNKIKFKFVGNSMYSKEIFKKISYKKKNKLIYLPYPYLKERYNEDFSFQAAFSGRFINMYNFYRNQHKSGILYSILRQILHFFQIYFEIFKNFKKVKQYYYEQNELNIIKEIRNFCNKNNLEFIIKPRLKFAYPDIYNKYADKIINDDESQQFPSILQKEISKSKIVIGSNSSAVYETAMFDKISINIEIPEIAFHSKSNKAFFTFLPNSEWNFKKVVYNYKIKEFIKKFGKMKIEDLKLDKAQHKKFLNKFCGINKNIDTGEKIYKQIKNYLK